MADYVMALDQGTTSSRTLIFDNEGRVVARAGEPLECLYPRPGWVEQRPAEIWESQRKSMERALHGAGLKMSDMAALGIANQRETVIAWNRETGEPVGNAIVWQCRRTAAHCARLKSEGFEQEVRQRTGLVVDPYFSGTKMRWMLENVPEVATLAGRGSLAFGTVDSWLIWNLSGGRAHLTDATNASRTMLFNIFTGSWDGLLLERLGIPAEALPRVEQSSGEVARTDGAAWGAEAPIAGVAGDQQAALFGQACFEPGMAKNTYGTGCFLLINTGSRPVISRHGLLTTIAWQLDGEISYALEGAVFIGGAVVQWLRDGLGLIKEAAETEELAEQAGDSGGVYLVPAFTGLGAPHWDPHARGTIVGITRETNRGHLVRAALESIAYQTREVLESMERDMGSKLRTLRVDGGAAANNFLCQFQADLLGCDVSRPELVETTAMGAAFLAGLGAGVWPDKEAIAKMWREERRFRPQPPSPDAGKRLEEWGRAVERAKDWHRED